MTGLHVAPTQPQVSAAASSAGSAESFHRTVGLVVVIRSSGESALPLGSVVVRVCVTRSPGWFGGARMFARPRRARRGRDCQLSPLRIACQPYVLTIEQMLMITPLGGPAV